MAVLQALLVILESRSFNSIWFWLMLATCWSLAGRNALGVPPDVIHKALNRKLGAAEQEKAAVTLLDWLSLMLPRWRVDPGEGPWLFGVAIFLLVSLAALGFVYGLEMAQALFLLLAPLGILVILRIRLAKSLSRIVERARSAEITVQEAASLAAPPMRRHRLFTSAMSIVTVALAAYWAALSLLSNPFGF